MKQTLISLAIVFLLFTLVYCGGKTSQKNVNDNLFTNATEYEKEGELVFRAKIDSTHKKQISIEIADNDAETEHGLMHRHNLPDSVGMLFVFPDSRPRSFWMKNTPISLDIIFVNENKQIVTIQTDTQPYSEAPIRSDKPAKYVVEVVAGFCSRYNIENGDFIEFERVR